ncbi:5'-nucleotidase [Turicibacter bilis]|uniref:5'-nucleotidase n=1 Tax=Turicibacter bilis TaxID=2735723 RepID=A0A9Q9CML2_9FIRM|nr:MULTISPECIES: 5'-nucleotidase [Turicibacter]AMC07908.1 5'-nucleotidase [Turicibacter sp. H121]MBS3199097.1 5'-nucleotidase [Turicibacter bilis]MBS3201332.1 5'-nucleotidase [Turicibacter bilis]MBS3202366.1 5'-nucleotidase [Turicibacter bilis]MCU7198519.1 5'-nucleotidase [Turicibacter sp. H121]
MAYDLSDKLVVAISSRALFDLEHENQIFENNGIEAYTHYQIEHENTVLPKGTAFPLIEALLSLNEKFEEPIVEVIILSSNSPETGLRVFNSISEYGLDIVRAAFTGGEAKHPYLEAFNIDLFLSRNEKEVQDAIDQGVAAALVYDAPRDYHPNQKEIRIAFDADAVVFSDESELIYKQEGLEAFYENENANAENAMNEGPFAKLLKTLSKIKEKDDSLLKIAIVTARNSPAHKRVILTLRKWGCKIDEMFFLGGVAKDKVLKAFNAHIFFDDQDYHVGPASQLIPSGRVPYKSDSKLHQFQQHQVEQQPEYHENHEHYEHHGEQS